MTAKSDYAATITTPSDTETVITREFDAPRELVWESMTKPEHVRQWYGLRSLNMTVCEIDLRVGGKWRYVQSDGENEFAFSGEYREIDPPGRLVSTEEFEAMPGTGYVVTLTLEERDGKTQMTSHLQYQSMEHRDGHIQSGMERGMNETFDRLDEHLQQMAAGASS
ncbi:MAG: SRPBCC family protein [Actinomycetota bacterium]